MLNWSQIRDIYGSAEDIPAVLDAAASETDWAASSWSELWGRLYHQGSVAPASYAAVPALCDIATARPEVMTDPALFLAAAILGSSDGPVDHRTARADYAAQIAALQPLARRKLELATDSIEFIYALRNVAILEDLGAWQHELEGLANGELELECPACGDHVYCEVADDALVATLDPDNLNAGSRLVAVSPTDLEPPEATLFEIAGIHGQRDLQGQLLQIFGHFTCPACNQRVRIADTHA